MPDLTRLLNATEHGEPQAAERLLPLVYDELRKLASHKLSFLPPGQTLQPTALVHEAWLRLVGNENPQFDGRGHFFAAAAEAMRRILIERARQKLSLKRGAGAQRVNLEELELAVMADDHTLLAVDEALTKLAKEYPDAAGFIKLRFFAGLSVEQAAAALGVSTSTAEKDWAYARSWMRVAIDQQSGRLP